MGRRQKLSCAQEQGPAERLPQVSQQLRNRLVYPKGHPSSQALTSALGSDKTTAPALATIIPHASAGQTSHKVCPATILRLLSNLRSNLNALMESCVLMLATCTAMLLH